MITRVARALLEDEDASGIPEAAILKRKVTDVSYKVKTSRKVGAGLTELDLSRVEMARFERNF